MNTKTLAWILIGVGSLFLLIGILYSFSNTPISQSATNSETEKPSSISISYTSYVNADWDQYGVGEDDAAKAARLKSVPHLWMRKKGYITYETNLPKTNKDLLITVRLSSELQDRTSTDQIDSSDVTLVFNDRKQETKNIISDNTSGKDYQWEIPNHLLQPGNNKITFKVGDGKYHNGLAIYSPIKLSFQ